MPQQIEPNSLDASSADILYGVAGWSYADWEGVVYPRGADGLTKLLTLGSACDLLEVNTTFYATPRPAMTAAWASRLGRAGLQTRMVVKVNQVFTHGEQYSADDVRALKAAIAPLDEAAAIDRHGIEHPRLLGLLMQFPAFFRLTPENSQRIERLAEDFADWTRIIELRHPSWAKPAALEWLRRANWSLANIDLPRGNTALNDKQTAGKPEKGDIPIFRPERQQQETSTTENRNVPFFSFPEEVAATGPVGYLRLHGRNTAAWFDRKVGVEQKYNYLYTPEELSDLADRIRELSRRTKTVVVVGNNHYRGKALATVLNLAHLVEGRRARVPATLIAEYPQLAGFAEAAEAIALPLEEDSGTSEKQTRPARDTKKKGAARKAHPKPESDQLELF